MASERAVRATARSVATVKLQAEAFLQSLTSDSRQEISHRATRTVARDAGISAVQLARQRKEAADSFNAREAMWTWPHEKLVHQQAYASQWSIAD